MRSERSYMSILVISLGLCLIAFPLVKTFVVFPYMVEKEQSRVLSLKYGDYLDNKRSSEQRKGLFDYSKIRSLGMLDFEAKADRSLVIGEIIIPSIETHLPIFTGTENESLKVGAGTMKPKQIMGEGNYALAGHNTENTSQLFSSIEDIVYGERIVVTDKKTAYIYRAVSKDVVLPERLDIIEDREGRKLITLVSCYSTDGSDRIVITGELLKTVEYKNLGEFLKMEVEDWDI